MKITKIALGVFFIGLISLNVSILKNNNSKQGLILTNLSATAQPGVELVQAYDCWSVLSGGICSVIQCNPCNTSMPFCTGSQKTMCHK